MQPFYCGVVGALIGWTIALLVLMSKYSKRETWFAGFRSGMSTAAQMASDRADVAAAVAPSAPTWQMAMVRSQMAHQLASEIREAAQSVRP